MGTTLPSPKRGQSPPKIFSAHIYCGQTAGWMKMVLGTEVGLSPGDLVVLDRDPAPSPKRGQSPSAIFRPFLLWPNGWMHQDATWYKARPQPSRLCVRWGPSYPQNRRHTNHQRVFGPCLLWPNGWMDEDATWYGSRPRPRPHFIRRGPSSA